MQPNAHSKFEKWTDGDEKNSADHYGDDNWTIYGFNPNVIVNEFRILIPYSGYNPKEIRLSYSNDSPTGNFTLIDTFKPFNGLLTESPFQKFSFPPISAKYIKVEMPSAIIFELQLWGTKE